MFLSKEVKNKAKMLIMDSYWYCVLVQLICHFLSWLIPLCVAILIFAYLKEYRYLSLVVFCIHMIFISMPLDVGLKNFFMNKRTNDKSIKNIFYAFQKGRYMKIMGTMLWRFLIKLLWSSISIAGLFAFLFTYNNGQLFLPNLSIYETSILGVSFLVLVIGVLITINKTIVYSQVPFILTDNYNIGFRRAIKLSKIMTKGNIKHIFTLHLSFVGWYILVSIPVIIGCIIFRYYIVLSYFILFTLTFVLILPYVNATLSEMYIRLKENAISNEICTREELSSPINRHLL